MPLDKGAIRCWSGRLQEYGATVDNPPMKLRALGFAATVAVLLVGPLALPAHAATSQGCSGTISSVNDQGASLDKITVPGPNGTAASPFRLYWAGPVTWTGQTDQVLTSGSWRVTVQNPSWLFTLGELVTGHTHGLSGTFDSAEGGTSFTGKLDIGFTVTGSGSAACTGVISVRVMDSLAHNPLWWLALILLIVGLVMLYVFGVSKLTRPLSARKRHVFANTFAGLFLATGVSLMMTLYGVLSWSATTSNLIIVVGVVLGLGVGLLPTRALGGSKTKTTRFDYSSLPS
jgi:uncharacterized membrane protein